jgi:SAM-dependent methyltransferase
MKAKLPQSEPRTIDQLREHYDIERELSDKLRSASKEERLKLYGVVYDELFKRVPLHPQLTKKAGPEAYRWGIERQIRLLAPLIGPQTTFLEIGSGDCALSIALAPLVRMVYSVDVSEEITANIDLPENVEIRISDGISIPVPERSIDVAYSNQLMEHLHPQDAIEHVANVFNTLVPGGKYLCVTPNRLSGPHDISKYFDNVATGFHLKEYTVLDLHRLFSQSEFTRADVYIGGRGRYFRSPPLPIEIFERLLAVAPLGVRRALANRFLVSGILGARVVGIK